MFGTIWLVLFGAVTCGISAGIFWSVEGCVKLSSVWFPSRDAYSDFSSCAHSAIVLGYPEASKRGRYLACWLFFKSGGQLLGGSINVALNSKPAGAGSVSFVLSFSPVICSQELTTETHTETLFYALTFSLVAVQPTWPSSVSLPSRPFSHFCSPSRISLYETTERR